MEGHRDLVIYDTLLNKETFVFARKRAFQKTTANHNADPGTQSLSGYMYETLPDLRLRKHGGKIARNRELVLKLCFLVMAEATPIRPHQQNCLNMR